MTEYLPELLHLSKYETTILSLILAVKRPILVRELYTYTDVPRTKVYGVIKNLMRGGLILANIHSLDEFKDDMPTVYDWWPEHKQASWQLQHLIGVRAYTPNLKYLESALNTKENELKHTLTRIDQVRDYLIDKLNE